jgi:hypothetical protein
MSRRELIDRVATSTLLFGYRDPLPLHSPFSMEAESEIPLDSDESAVSGSWREGDKKDQANGEPDFQVPRVMEEVMRYIRSIDVNSL